MRKLFVALLMLLGAAASMVGLALAQSGDDPNGDLPNKLVTPWAKAGGRSGGLRQSPARVSAEGGSTWVGHSIQTVVGGDPTTYSFGPYRVGRGDNRPGGLPGDANYRARNSGVWTWDLRRLDLVDT